MTGWSHYAALENPRETAAWSHWSQWSHLFPSVFVRGRKTVAQWDQWDQLRKINA